MISLRPARQDDFDALRSLLPPVLERAGMGGLPIDDGQLIRTLVTAIAFEDGFARVVERNGVLAGGMIAFVAPNALGVRTAQDVFTWSACGTDRLLRAYLRWARGRGARVVQVMDLSDNPRYQRLIQCLGLKPSGQNFMGVY